jgi:hypothetical protein
MENVDVQIYVSNFIKFFKDNPEELAKVIGQGTPDDFFAEVKKAAYENYEKGEDIELTHKQIISIVLKINNMSPEEEPKVSGPFMETSWGNMFLN